MGELITQNVIFNKKTIHGLHSFYKLNEKEAPLPSATPFISKNSTKHLW